MGSFDSGDIFTKAIKAIKVIKVIKAIKVLKVFKDMVVRLELKEQLVYKVPQVLKE